MYNFKTLKKLARGTVADSSTCRMALVGDTATQFLATALKGESIGRGFQLELFEAEYNQVERQFLDPTSELYAFDVPVDPQAGRASQHAR